MEKENHREDTVRDKLVVCVYFSLKSHTTKYANICRSLYLFPHTNVRQHTYTHTIIHVVLHNHFNTHSERSFVTIKRREKTH